MNEIGMGSIVFEDWRVIELIGMVHLEPFTKSNADHYIKAQK